GIQTRVRHHVHDKGNAIALATFTPAGAAAFLRQPVEELTNRTEALGEVVADARLTALAPQLANASDHSGRLRVLENLLAQRLSSAEVDPWVAAAAHWIETASPGARIDDLVRHIGLSQSALERRFRRIVGVSPKRFASLARLKLAARLHATGVSLTAIAHA